VYVGAATMACTAAVGRNLEEVAAEVETQRLPIAMESEALLPPSVNDVRTDLNSQVAITGVEISYGYRKWKGK
jgi:hypothetical protein